MKKILLLIIVIVFAILAAELFFRAFYFVKGVPVGADANEVCLKKMKLAMINQNSSSRFVWPKDWSFDPWIGATLTKGLDDVEIYRLKRNGRLVDRVRFGEDQHNNAGLHNVQEYSLRKPSNVSVRIALLGDSFACGREAPLLYSPGELLQGFIPKSEVLNFCVPGSGTSSMFARYVRDAQKYNPDVVIMNVYVSDFMRPFECVLKNPNVVITPSGVDLLPHEFSSEKDFFESYNLPKLESYFLKHVSFVWSEWTKYERYMDSGLVLFGSILDELKKRTAVSETLFFVSLILGDDDEVLQSHYYAQAKRIVESKDIILFDSDAYFDGLTDSYKNQSFYFVSAKNPSGHFSVTGYALYTQGLKQIIEQVARVPNTPEFHFANFNTVGPIIMVPTTFNVENDVIKVLRPYVYKEANFSQRVISPFAS